jgi:uncharacterized RDD family membrane protein YckC
MPDNHATAAPQLAATGPSFPAAGIDRRFYAFALDHLIGWAIDLAVGGFAYHYLLSRGHVLVGVLVILAAMLLVGAAFAVMLGVSGTTPGKHAFDLRAVQFGNGLPMGVGPAMLRGLILGLATLPTFGFGLATLAWTAVADPSRLRRAWHDRVASSIVVDVRPVVVAEQAEDVGPRHVVNLTAMRLVPIRPTGPAPTPPQLPTRAPSRSQQRPPAAAPAPQHFPEAELQQHPAQPVAQQPVAQQPVQPPVQQAPAPPPVSEQTTVRDPSIGRHTAQAAPTGAPQPRWGLAFDTGQRVPVEAIVLVGRRPEARPGEEGAQLVPLASADMSVSKTHAQIVVMPDGALVVTDRGSTNGSTINRQGATKPLTAGHPATLLEGDVVSIGDRTMTVVRIS